MAAAFSRTVRLNASSIILILASLLKLFVVLGMPNRLPSPPEDESGLSAAVDRGKIVALEVYSAFVLLAIKKEHIAKATPVIRIRSLRFDKRCIISRKSFTESTLN